MFYKFFGGDETSLLEAFDKAAVSGSVRFTSALSFNDPFEFKFNAVAPSRDAFDAWHQLHAPDRSGVELENAWASFSGPGADWNTEFVPRQNLLNNLYVLCLSRRWDSHLMWAHYTRDHQGYALIYRPEIVTKIAALGGCGDVGYQDKVPDLRWFEGSLDEMLRPVLFTKPEEWAYEREFRLVISGPEGERALHETIDPNLVAGVILGTRASHSLSNRALALQQIRPDFIVQKVTSDSRSYGLATYDVVANRWQFGHML